MGRLTCPDCDARLTATQAWEGEIFDHIVARKPYGETERAQVRSMAWIALWWQLRLLARMLRTR